MNSLPALSHFKPLEQGPGPSDPGPPPPPDAPEPPRREPAFRIPPATGWLIALNVAVLLALSFLSDDQQDVIVYRFGFEPARLLAGRDPMALMSLLSYQFLHGGWDHLGINMVSLLAFGPGIERPLGAKPFVLIYLLSGIAGALVQMAVTPGSDDPLVGASASISGVFGALLILWRFGGQGKRKLGILPLALLWIALLAVTGILGVGSSGAPVAWIAHIGGFLAGMALVKPIARGLGPRV